MADVLAVGVHGVLEGSRLRLPGVPSPKSLGFRCVQNGPPARREEGAYLNGYVTDEQRSRRPIFIATLGPWPVGCFSALLAPYVSIQDTLVATASPARTALKNSQMTCGETYAYFGDRTLGTNQRFEAAIEQRGINLPLQCVEHLILLETTPTDMQV